jgi:Meiotically up-regulated gene 113
MSCGVYLIRASGTDFYKIGNSLDVQKRFRSLQGMNPLELELIHVWECRPRREGVFDKYGRAGRCKLEKYLHTLMEPYRVRANNEWFKFSDAEVAELHEAVVRYKSPPRKSPVLGAIDLNGTKPKGMRISKWLQLLWQHKMNTPTG